MTSDVQVVTNNRIKNGYSLVHISNNENNFLYLNFDILTIN